MKNLDLVSKCILVIALSLTMVLCSASLFIYSIKNANAETLSEKSITNKSLPEIQAACCGIGISNGNAYFIKYVNDGHYFLSMSPLTDFQNYDKK